MYVDYINQYIYIVIVFNGLTVNCIEHQLYLKILPKFNREMQKAKGSTVTNSEEIDLISEKIYQFNQEGL